RGAAPPGPAPGGPPLAGPTLRRRTTKGTSMDLTSDTTCLYLRHAFGGMERVLDRLDDENVNQKPEGWGTNSVAGLIVHCCELAPSWFEMPGLGRDSLRD